MCFVGLEEQDRTQAYRQQAANKVMVNVTFFFICRVEPC